MKKKALVLLTIVTLCFIPGFDVKAAEDVSDVDAATVGDAEIKDEEVEPDTVEIVCSESPISDSKTDASVDDSNVKSQKVIKQDTEKKDATVSKAPVIKAQFATVQDGVNYSSVYDYNYYVSLYPDIWNAFGRDDVSVLRHFVQYGMKEGRIGNDTFNVYSYKNAYEDLRNAFGLSIADYYTHYLRYGMKEGRSKTSGINSIVGSVTKYNGTDYSAVYDYSYYTGKYADIKRVFNGDDIRTLKHFVDYGMREGRQAKESFSVDSYAKEYQDLRRAFKNDLPKYYQHYMTYGKKEGRKTSGTKAMKNPAKTYGGVDYSPVYDYEYYVSKNPDVKKAFGYDDEATLQHLINYGMNERRSSIQTFNITSYAYRYVDLRRAFKDDYKAYYVHYAKYGVKEKRQTTGCSKMLNFETSYEGFDYGSEYDFNAYWGTRAEHKSITSYDDLAAVKYFAEHDSKKIVMTSAELVRRLKILAGRNTFYKNKYPYNLCYINEDGRTSADCLNLYKALFNGYDVTRTDVGYFQKDLSNTGDCGEWKLLNQCIDISQDFTKLKAGEPRLLYKDGHIGGYIGEEVTIGGKVYNVIECTVAWQGGILYSFVDKKGNRYQYKGGTKRGAWTHHGKMSRWIEY